METFKFQPGSSCPSLASDLEEARQNADFADVQVTCEGGETSIPAFSVVLKSRSKVFAAMLKEKPNAIHLEKVPLEAAEAFIAFLHSDNCPHVDEELGLELLRLAHVYEVSKLKSVIETNLVFLVNVENALRIVDAAEKFEATAVKKKCLALISDNRDIIDSASFKEMKAENASLAFEILEFMVRQQSSSRSIGKLPAPVFSFGTPTVAVTNNVK